MYIHLKMCITYHKCYMLNAYLPLSKLFYLLLIYLLNVHHFRLDSWQATHWSLRTTYHHSGAFNNWTF